MSKCCIDIIAVKENVKKRVGETHAPQHYQKSYQGIAVIDQKTFVSWCYTWFANVRIDGPDFIHSHLGTIHTDATFSFAYCPLKGSEEETVDEVDKESRKVNMESILFFCREFCFDISGISCNCRVIIIGIANLDLGDGTCVVTYKRTTFREETKRSLLVSWRKISWS